MARMFYPFMGRVSRTLYRGITQIRAEGLEVTWVMLWVGPLLAESRRPDLGERGSRLEDREFQRRRRPLPLSAALQRLARGVRGDLPAEQVALSGREPGLLRLPPRARKARMGPREILVGIGLDVLVLRVVVGTRLESFGLIAVEVLVREVDAGDHREGLAGDAGDGGDGGLVEQPRDGLGIAGGAGGDHGVPERRRFLRELLAPRGRGGRGHAPDGEDERLARLASRAGRERLERRDGGRIARDERAAPCGGVAHGGIDGLEVAR